MKLSKINEESFGVNSGFGGANTEGTRSSVDKKWPDKVDFNDEEDVNSPDNTPDKLKKSNIYQPILKEPNDHMKPKGNPKGPGD